MVKAYDRDSGGGGGGSSELRDAYIRHGINLTRYSNYEARRLLEILDSANVQVRRVITRAKGIETKEKYRRVSAEIRRMSKELGKQLNGQLELDFKELAGEESRFVENALRNIGVTADFELPAPAKVWSAASFGVYEGYGKNTYKSFLDTFGDNVFKTWDSQVRAGYLAGLTAKQINRNVLGSVKDMEPGQMQALRKSLEMNTRTMVAHMAETARDETYRQNNRLFSGYRYVGTLDSRTCLVCGELDGKKFETLEEAPQLPAHPRCRCLYLPVIKGMEDFDYDDERASADGPVSANTTYEDWLKTQPDEVIQDILGPTRYEMYKNGAEISSFVTDGKTLTLEQLRDKEGISEIMSATMSDEQIEKLKDKGVLVTSEKELKQGLKDFKKHVEYMEEPYKNVYSRYAETTELKKDPLRMVAIGYDDEKDYLVYNPRFLALQKYQQPANIVFPHELAHRYDVLEIKSWENKDFVGAIENAMNKVQGDIEKYNNLYKSLNNVDPAIQDILGALSNNKIKVKYTHEWKDMKTRALEIFANASYLQASHVKLPEFDGLLDEIMEISRTMFIKGANNVTT